MSEISSSIDDQALDDWGDPYKGIPLLILWGDQEADDTHEVMHELLGHQIVFGFNNDEFMPRPSLITEYGSFVGQPDIHRAISRIIVPKIIEARSSS